MNKILMTVLCAAVLAGCRTHSVTPDESWSDYARYYKPTGAVAAPVDTRLAVDIKMVKSAQAESAVAAAKAKGDVLLGIFKIEDGTEISSAAVQALARKLNASTVIWSVVTDSSFETAMPNGDLGVPGVDYTQMARMNINRPYETVTEQTMHVHTIWMLGKK